jgi:hypothetical protein
VECFGYNIREQLSLSDLIIDKSLFEGRERSNIFLEKEILETLNTYIKYCNCMFGRDKTPF